MTIKSKEEHPLENKKTLTSNLSSGPNARTQHNMEEKL